MLSATTDTRARSPAPPPPSPVPARCWTRSWPWSPVCRPEVAKTELHRTYCSCASRRQKAGKNRLPLDLRPRDQAAEVARLEELGARRVDVG
ncbi:VOC family protein [Plantactinospora solaniradicis]|uniref:VOC family protein n=1 Tax=Plantactinospora solaniradicis TaxID=1723736 RepID=A0ABW1KFL9_9ACTN